MSPAPIRRPRSYVQALLVLSLGGMLLLASCDGNPAEITATGTSIRPGWWWWGGGPTTVVDRGSINMMVGETMNLNNFLGLDYVDASTDQDVVITVSPPGEAVYVTCNRESLLPPPTLYVHFNAENRIDRWEVYCMEYAS